MGDRAHRHRHGQDRTPRRRRRHSRRGISAVAAVEPLDPVGQLAQPVGVLIAQASDEGYRRRDGEGPSPLHGYYFRILQGQGKAAKGGAADYVVNGEMSGGFALVAWPVHYDASGVMTFIVNRDGSHTRKTSGPRRRALAQRITRYDPDESWRPAQTDAAGTP